MVLMTACHVLLVFPELRPWAFAVGDSALPIFAAMIVWHVAASPERLLPQYLHRLALWALLSQPAYAWVRITFSPWWSMNAMVSLLAGVIACALLHQRRLFLLLPLFTTVLLLDRWQDGGAAMPMAMVAGFFLLRQRQWSFLAVLALMMVAHCLDPLLFWTKSSPWLLGGALLAFPSWELARRLPALSARLPAYTFYIWYPLHLALIALISGPYKA